MDDEFFRLWAEMDETDRPGNPWGGMARDFHHETGSPIGDCVDLVILHYLRSGYVRPLTDLFEHKFSPGPRVLRYLSQMLEPSVSTEEEVPYLPRARVATTVAASYMTLLGGGAP